MKFDDKEMAIVLAKKIDKITFSSKGVNVLEVDLNKIIQKRIESDDSLKKQLLEQALQSDS